MKLKGYSLITGVLLLSAIIIVALLSVASFNVQSGKTEFSARSYRELRAFGDGCFEESIIRLKKDPSFTSGSLSDGGNSCTIDVVTNGDDVFEISLATRNINGQSLNILAEIERTMIQEAVNINLINFTIL